MGKAKDFDGTCNLDSAANYLPPMPTLATLAKAADWCRGCCLYKDATQVVFGQGSSKASVVLIGEQPGDEEDIEGRPFVGPAGRLLDQLLEEAGLARDEVYVTNAVKHFKFTKRGKRRLHKKPNRTEIVACRPWLENELEIIQPQVIVCLGATAASAVLGPNFRLTRERGNVFSTIWCDQTIGTYHPSAALRAPTSEMRSETRDMLTEDLRLAKNLAGGRRKRANRKPR